MLKSISINLTAKSVSIQERLKYTFGCNLRALALFRISLASLLLSELILRFRYLHVFYSDEGTLPLHLLYPKTDILYKCICVHCLSGSMIYQSILLSIQVCLAFLLLIGYKPQSCAFLSWFLYLSLTLRNTWLAFILDRYFHYLLFYASFLPTGYDLILLPTTFQRSKDRTAAMNPNTTICTLATIAFKLQVLWIYLDAGSGKYMDPLRGWTYNADPLPALDTYTRHTIGARYLYGLLGPFGLRLLTPTVVYAELLACPIALYGSFTLNWYLVLTAVGIICSLHVGISITLRNTVLLSFVACAAWMAFLPPCFADTNISKKTNGTEGNKESTRNQKKKSIGKLSLNQRIFILCFISGSLWFEMLGDECNQSMKHIWSTLLHNRWNVFVGAEEYVTWEIAPGRLNDGSIVDVWGKTDTVSWEMPISGTPCTSTARHGRWRSFPYLAELDGEDGYVLWEYLCTEWNDARGNEDDGRKLLRFNFFMLQADVLPNMGFSATRKRLIQSHECGSVVEYALEDNSPEL